MREGRPSTTARKVATDFLFMVQDPVVESLAPPGSAPALRELLRAVGVLKPWMESLMRARWYRRFAERIVEPMLPGHLLHLVLRKRFFDDEVRAAIAGGVSQVLVVGAGYDTLCLRLAVRFPEVAFLEIDHPATSGVKAGAIEAIGGSRPNLHLLPVDLAKRSLEQGLRESGVWCLEAPSVVVAEGVVMYLREQEVAALLAALRSCSAAGSRLLFSYLQTESEAPLGCLGGVLRGGLRLLGEPWRWAIDEADVGPFLARHGYAIDGDPSRFDLARRYLEPAGQGTRELARLERVVSCRTVSSARSR